jgi:hypothetical protein
MWDGQKHGQGTCTYKFNGTRFTGIWVHNVPIRGDLFFKNGDRLSGEWRSERFEGSGSIYFSNKNVYEGEWK